METKYEYQEVKNIKVSNIKPIKFHTRRTGFKVAKFTKDGIYITTYKSVKDATIAICEEQGVDYSISKYTGIIKACGNNTTLKSIYGYQWRYVHDNGEIVKRKIDNETE